MQDTIFNTVTETINSIALSNVPFTETPNFDHHQRFPFGHDKLKNILVRPFKFGMWVYMGNAMNAIVLLP